jgi:hypothetical protein
MPLINDKKFMEKFGIPSGHRLESKYYTHAGDQENGYKHEEFDENGELIARYESWMNSTIYAEPTDSGWQKIDLSGNAVKRVDN